MAVGHRLVLDHVVLLLLVFESQKVAACELIVDLNQVAIQLYCLSVVISFQKGYVLYFRGWVTL